MPSLSTLWSTALVTFSPILLILVRFQKETLQLVHCHVEQPCFQVKVFTWDSFLQMVKNISVLSLVMHFLNEVMVNTTQVLKEHLCHQFLLCVAWTKHLLHGWWHILYFQYEPWWCVWIVKWKCGIYTTLYVINVFSIARNSADFFTLQSLTLYWTKFWK